ncbi:IS256 family transposase [Metabacillus sp. GX 13764]|uniref:IS256 family transposase n=1 Tax=Metabacillus kandeliae TaxID=2900151 RepID=UPI001E463FFE|nr:IS256 family transposase [Metabacillus kandeliae]MCD7036744.1 IS256 family transposase [Metabacillus kandeliae]
MNNSNITQSTLGDQLEELVKQFVQEKLEMMLREEIHNFLKVEQEDVQNSRNGYYERTLDTKFGKIDDLSVPRDRNGDFQTAIFQPYQRRDGWLEEAILSLYQNGVSTRQVGKFVERMLGNCYSAATVSNITEKIREDISAWQVRPIKENYCVVYLDALFFKVRRDTVEKEAIYIVMGVTLEGKREILGFFVGGQESSNVWKGILEGLRKRGLEKVLLGVFDGLGGLEDAFREVYPKADVQRCVVHKVRNAMSQVRKVDQPKMAEDLKTIYTANDLEEAEKAFQTVKETWTKKYKKLMDSWEDQLDVLLTFYKYPKQIRKYLYTTNMIERTIKEIRKRLKTMNSLPSIEAVEKIVYLVSHQYNTAWTSKATPGYGLASKEIYEMFEERYPAQP